MKIAVFGLGFMGSTHLKAIKNIPQAELVAVADTDAKRLSGDLSGIQGNIGGPGEKLDFAKLRRYADWREAVKDPEIEAVDVCFPTVFHSDVTIGALQAGKHVLVEKPMGLTAEAADTMVREAEKSGKILMSAQVLRFFPAYSAMFDAVKSGSVGQVRSAIFRRRCCAPEWSPWIADKKSSGGGVFDLLIHDIDFCLHMFGKPEAVSAVGHEDLVGGIDWITAEFYYPNVGGVIVSGGWHHRKSFPFSMEFSVLADGGTYEFHSASTPLTLFRANGEKETVAVAEKDPYQAEIEYFLDCCAQGKQPEFCPPRESADSVKLALLAVESREKKGEKLPCRF